MSRFDEIGEQSTEASPTREVGQLVFDGRPVVGNESIRADFASKALRALNALFSDLARQLQSRLPQPSPAQLPTLMIAGTARGSFGFELDEGTLKETKGVLRATSELLDAAKDDDRFALVVQDADREVLKSFTVLLRVLSGGGATVRMSGSGWRGSIEDSDALRDALRRTASVRDEADVVLAGTLTGLLPDERRFEFTIESSGEIIKGTVPKQVFERIGDRLRNGVLRRGTARFLVRSFDRPWGGRQRTTHQLLDFDQVQHS